LIFTSFIFNGCTEKKEDSKQSRWYTQEMIQKGKPLYEQNCASCHGLKGQGTAKVWSEKLPNGRFPPPPLNSEAHAYHHPLKALRFTIQNGGKYVGGVMPAFNEKLNDEDTDNIIAYFQNFWGDEFYEEWLRRGGLTK
jgi:mono/diheme cytochrome c family protein